MARRRPQKPNLTESSRIRVARRAATAEDLLAPVDAVTQMVNALLDGGNERAAAMRADLMKIRAAADAFRGHIENLFDHADTKDLSVAFSLKNLPREQRHDLRTPMNHLIGFSEMLLEELRDDDQEELETEVALTKILGWSRRLLTMFDRLTSEQDTKDSTRDDIDTTQMIRHLVRTIEPAEVDPAVQRDRSAGRILIVDDNDINRDLLKHQLEKLGHVTAEAANGDEALRMMAEGNHDVMLLDVIMPGKNGIEVLAELRRDARHRYIPVIMLSALDDISSVVRCIEIGAEDYIGKPFEWSLLKARIGAALEKKRLRDRETEYLKQIDRERRFSDRLLRVILPDEVIDELKRTQTVRPRRHEEVAVLFSDIVSFTSYCEANDPETVVGQLQDLVESFETLAAQHGMYKVKTIGDAFMATAGLLKPIDDPVRTCVELGLAMNAATRKIASHWQIRTGIHSGPVVAGVLGKQQFAFDLWGDTVNTAFRMVDKAEPGTIALSGSAWNWIASCAKEKSRSTVAVKGKGEMEVVLFEEFHAE